MSATTESKRMTAALAALFLITCPLVCGKPLIRRERSLVLAHVKLWPNATVPYRVFNENSSNVAVFTDFDMQLIEKAMRTIEEETCIRFRDLGTAEPPKGLSYLNIVGTNSGDCFSDLGVVGKGGQDLIINSLCRSVGQILHELAHALGMMHELMRPDRDKYIRLREENILPGYEAEFEKLKPEESQLWDREFDFQSITLYDPFTFTANSYPVWEPTAAIQETPLYSLSEKDLSFEDAAALNRLYKCSGKCSKRRRACRADEFMSKRCRCETKEAYAYRRCQNDRKQTEYCRKVIDSNKCYSEAKFAIPFCRKICGRCFRAGIFGNFRSPVKYCIDLEPELCRGFVKEGYCYFDRWTKLNCQRSCSLCPSAQAMQRHADHTDARLYLADRAAGGCFNRFEDLRCDLFAERGDCKSNPGFMLNYCSQSCGACRNGSVNRMVTAKPPCKNYIDDQLCDALAKQGKCTGVTLKQCLGSCNKCGKNYERQSTTPAPTTTASPAPLCKDNMDNCAIFVQRGDCKSDEKRMRFYCPLSCGFCQPKCHDLDPSNVCSELVLRNRCSQSDERSKRCAKSCGLCGERNLPRKKRRAATGPGSVIAMRKSNGTALRYEDLEIKSRCNGTELVGPHRNVEDKLLDVSSVSNVQTISSKFGDILYL